MKKILIETDIGQDPDDFFALLYLISANADIKGIVLSPGDSFQVAITKFVLKECGKEDIPVGVSSKLSTLQRKTKFHYSVLEKYNYPQHVKVEYHGPDLMRQVRDLYPEVDFFLIGPLYNMKEYVESDVFRPITRTVMQGGFVPSWILESSGLVPLAEQPERFRGKNSFTTFNLCSYREGGQILFDTAMLKSFVTKNLCNTLFYTKEINERIKPENRAMELFKECGSLLLSKKEEKKMHDVYAATYLLHPEIFKYMRGFLYYDDDGKCSAYADDSGDILVSCVDREKMWDCMVGGY